MKCLFPVFSLLFLMVSCNNNSNSDTSQSHVDSPSSIQDSLSHFSEVLRLKTDWDSIEHHKIAKESDTIILNSADYTKLEAVIISKKAGNIRINQILLPENQSDGPFGKDIAYPLEKNKEYKLIIGESLMQGDAFEGDYTLRFRGQN